jgi:hypothetical protein
VSPAQTEISRAKATKKPKDMWLELVGGIALALAFVCLAHCEWNADANADADARVDGAGSEEPRSQE